MPERKRKPAPPLVEWIVGAFGAALFVAMLAVVIWNGVANTESAPSIAVRVDNIEPGEHGFAVRFTARNDGDATAATVRIQARLLLLSGESETREATLDYLPPHSTRRGGFLFSSDPRGRPLAIDTQGYADP